MNTYLNATTIKRFGLHLLVAAVLGAVVAIPQFVGVFQLPEYANVFVATVCASLAAFVRKQEQTIDSGS